MTAAIINPDCYLNAGHLGTYIDTHPDDVAKWQRDDVLFVKYRETDAYGATYRQ